VLLPKIDGNVQVLQYTV